MKSSKKESVMPGGGGGAIWRGGGIDAIETIARIE